MQPFTKAVSDKLKYYIYLYIDPRDNKIFYVGKGKCNRLFDHLKEKSEKEKVQKINEIRNSGKEPIIEILVHGINDEYTAMKIEASIIDLLHKEELTNIQRGYESKEFGRMNVDQIKSLYYEERVEIAKDHKVILIKINTSFRYSMESIELYDITRSAWKIDPEKHNPKYALAIYNSIVQEVYEITKWLPENSTFNTKKENSAPNDSKRWEFVGKLAKEEIRKKYKYKNVDIYYKKGNQNPIMYVNC